MTHTDLHPIIHAAQAGDRAAGHALLRHVTRSADPTLLLLGLAAAAHPHHRRCVITQACAWWGAPSLTARWFHQHKPPPHRRLADAPVCRPINPIALRADASAQWLKRDYDGYTLDRWHLWRALIQSAPPSALSNAVTLAMPATDRWPPHTLRLPPLWLAITQRGQPFPPLRLVRSLTLHTQGDQAALLSHPDLCRVTYLQWWMGVHARYGHTTESVQASLHALAQAPMAMLQRLYITWRVNSSPNIDISPLTHAPWMNSLQRLHIHSRADQLGFPDEAFIHDLCARDPQGLRDLSLQSVRITPALTTALNASSLIRRLSSLSLSLPRCFRSLDYLTAFGAHPDVIAKLRARERRYLQSLTPSPNATP
jgi:hypothetical protein